MVVEICAGRREIIVQLANPLDGGGEGGEEGAGFVTLYLPSTETGPFRAEVEKLLVSPQFRKQGVARQLMRKVEEVALDRGKGLLMLSTTIGSDAESVYPKLGYLERGRMPKYGIHPLTGELVDEVLFYKDLRDHGKRE